VVGRPFPGTVWLRQTGTMRLGPRWLPFDAKTSQELECQAATED